MKKPLTNAERQARHRKKVAAALPARNGPYDVLRLYYSEEHDQFFLVAHDETAALPLPRDYHGQWDEIRKPEADRLNCYGGFVPWPPRGIPPR